MLTTIHEGPVSRAAAAELRARELLRELLQSVHKHTDRLFAWLMILQWIGGIGIALVVSPRMWVGTIDRLHIHVFAAIFVGATISALPITLALLCPGRPVTRHVIACAQMLWSALLIHLTGGRIETHFHVFGSLAFLAFYRDWKVFLPATVIVALDHLIRGTLWPQSVFGVAFSDQWRWAEHTAWVLFEDYVLIKSCLRGVAEARQIACRTAELEVMNRCVEATVRDQTAEIRGRENLFRSLTASSPVGVFSTDADPRRLVFVNDKCATITGLPVAHMLEHAWWDIIDGGERDQVLCEWLAAAEQRAEFSREFRIVVDAGAFRWVHMRASPLIDDRNRYVGTLEDISARKKSELEHARLTTAIEQARDVVIVTDANGVIEYVNPAFVHLTGYTSADVVGETPRILKSGTHDAAFYQGLWRTITRGETWTGRITNRKKNGGLFDTDAVISVVRDHQGRVSHFVEILRDVTLQKSLETQLRESRRLESIGQLAAGIAHEINTPMQYVSDNTRFLQEAFRGLVAPLEKARTLIAASADATVTREALTELQLAMAAADVEFLAAEIPRAVEQSLEGIERVSSIVRSMKEFSHPSAEVVPTDLNRAIQNTITVARNEWKYVADVETELGEGLGTVPCVLGEINRVVLNLLVNAAHAIADVVGATPGTKGRIRVSTRCHEAWAEIQISDSGSGIPAAIRDRIFDPFFTTKPVGKGTGQGLTIAQAIVVKKHRGTITVDSEVGKGTTFTIRLPLVAPPELEPACGGD